MRVLDLFSGHGGMSLGLERAGMTTVAFCDIEPYCRAWLAQQWPEVPIYDDVRSLDAAAFRGVDIVAGGFPCQDISVAGKGEGIDGARSGLWAEMFRIVCDVRPRWVLAENVPALRTRGADRVLGDLESAGYACWPLVVGARHVGAPHRRDRVWIIAHKQRVADGNRWGRERERFADHADKQSAPRTVADGCHGQAMGDSCRAGRQERHAADLASNARHAARQRPRWPAPPGCEQHDWEPPRVVGRPQPRLGRDADGLPVRLGSALRRARLRALGNSVVPQVVEAIGRTLMAADQAIMENW